MNVSDSCSGTAWTLSLFVDHQGSVRVLDVRAPGRGEDDAERGDEQEERDDMARRDHDVHRHCWCNSLARSFAIFIALLLFSDVVGEIALFALRKHVNLSS